MAASNGPSIWWLIPGVALLLGAMSVAMESGQGGEYAVAWATVLLVFAVPIVILARLIQKITKRNSKTASRFQ